MPEEQIPRQVVGSIGTLISRCPNCGGYGCRRLASFDYEGPDDECKVCGPIRKWMLETHGIEFEVKL